MNDHHIQLTQQEAYRRALEDVFRHLEDGSREYATALAYLEARQLAIELVADLTIGINEARLRKTIPTDLQRLTLALIHALVLFETGMDNFKWADFGAHLKRGVAETMPSGQCPCCGHDPTIPDVDDEPTGICTLCGRETNVDHLNPQGHCDREDCPF